MDPPTTNTLKYKPDFLLGARAYVFGDLCFSSDENHHECAALCQDLCGRSNLVTLSKAVREPEQADPTLLMAAFQKDSDRLQGKVVPCWMKALPGQLYVNQQTLQQKVKRNTRNI